MYSHLEQWESEGLGTYSNTKGPPEVGVMNLE